MNALSPRAEQILARLRSWPRKRIPLPELWQILDDADPATRTYLHRRTLLADTLRELAATLHIVLPGKRSYDRAEQPPLPLFVTLPGVAPTQPPPKPVIWHPSLSWAADEQIPPTHRLVLEKVNRWLFTHRGELVVPLRERSTEILGDEKAFDRLYPTGLFGPGRLSLTLLRAKRVAPPLHLVHIGNGPLMLVAENSDTFDSLATAMRQTPGRVGTVAWGAGTAFEATVLSVANLPHPPAEISYFGDLDAAGLQIPASASRQSQTIGLPAIKPALGLYTALQQLGRPQPGQKWLAPTAIDAAIAWLDPIHRSWAAGVLSGGERIAQESIGLEFLLTHDSWRIDL